MVSEQGTVEAYMPEFSTSQKIAYPLRLGPSSQISYFEQRKPFNIIAWLKTPYGLMIGFMVFSLVVMPLLKVDPEEYQQMLEEKKKLNEAVSQRLTGSTSSRGTGTVTHKRR